MEYGQPSTGAPSAAIAVAHAVLDADPMGYWENPGLKARIARIYAEDHGVDIAAEQVILTCGASPALVLALNCLFAPGDRVALARPGYVAYRNVLKALHMVPVELECGEAERFQLTAGAIAALDPPPAGVILASPANPTGTIIAPGELEAIARLCRQRGIRLVSDEIYHGITYGAPARSALSVDPDALVINSFSKYLQHGRLAAGLAGGAARSGGGGAGADGQPVPDPAQPRPARRPCRLRLPRRTGSACAQPTPATAR